MLRNEYEIVDCRMCLRDECKTIDRRMCQKGECEAIDVQIYLINKYETVIL